MEDKKDWLGNSMFMDFTPTKDDRFQMVIPHHLALIIILGLLYRQTFAG